MQAKMDGSGNEYFDVETNLPPEPTEIENGPSRMAGRPYAPPSIIFVPLKPGESLSRCNRCTYVAPACGPMSGPW